MINRYFQVDAPRTDAMHAEPIAALRIAGYNVALLNFILKTKG
jgi:hypothetical protein